MAVRCSPSPPLPIQRTVKIKRPVTKLLVASLGQISLKKTPQLQIRSTCRNTIFEDQSEGIVCYTDDDGVIICEGYDEGPRLQTLHHQPSRTAYNPRENRDAEIINLLQKNWPQMVKGSELRS